MTGCRCGCCSGVQVSTPADTYNRPGLDALSRRVGTYGQLFASAQARIAGADQLAGLTTRDLDDPAIALLDGWSVLGDVLTFYQERIANEGYLRTATELDSLVALGRLVGYRPRPALAASAYLAYTVDPGSRTTIPAGAQARSVPGPGEQPQTFETSDDLEARDVWNTLAVRRFAAPAFHSFDAGSMAELRVDGTLTSVKPGDRLVFFFVDSAPVPRVVATSTPDFVSGTTVLDLISPPSTDVSDWAKAATVVAELTSQALTADPDLPVTEGIRRVLGGFSTDAAISDAPTDQFLRTLAGFAERLPEDIAITRPRATGIVAAWIDDFVVPVQAAVSVLVPLAYAAAHLPVPAMTFLRDYAQDLLCPPDSSASPSPPPGEGKTAPCSDGAAIAGLTPTLAALRKPPATVPASAIEVRQDPASLFAPQSDVAAKLLAAADSRLAAVLYRAWSTVAISDPPPVSGVEVMRVRARPLLKTDESENPSEVVFAATAGDLTLPLDAIYDGITVGSYVVIDHDDDGSGVRTDVVRVTEVSQQVFTQVVDASHDTTVKVPATVITIDGLTDLPDLTQVTVWAQGEPLRPLGDPEVTDVAGAAIELDRLYDGLTTGRWLIISGERTDVPFATGVTGTELVMVGGVEQRVDPRLPGDTVHTTIELVNPLAFTYKRSSVTIYGNVVAATQGDSRTEVLGSGDASVGGQTFTLRQVTAALPLTSLPADTPTGALDAVTVRVNAVRWHEVEGLVWAGSNDHAYEVATPPGTAAVTFGDGTHGARPSTGTENVTAVYRIGAGEAGNVAAMQIAQLATRPLGVNAVVNPLPASGGSAGDGPDDARAVTPLRVHALDRLVSTQDYEDFTRARAGIGKASARRLFDGRREVVHVTIAGMRDAPIDPSSLLFASLEASLADFGDPHLPVRVAVRDLVTIVMAACVHVQDDYAWSDVEPAVRTTVLDTLGFTRTELGRPAYLSAVVAAMQAVPGVDYVDVDVFTGISSQVTPIDLLTAGQHLQHADPCVPADLAAYRRRTHQVQDSDTLTSVAVLNGLTLDELVALNPDVRIRLDPGSTLTLSSGIQPAQLAVLPPTLPEALTLRRIP